MDGERENHASAPCTVSLQEPEACGEASVLAAWGSFSVGANGLTTSTGITLPQSVNSVTSLNCISGIQVEFIQVGDAAGGF